VGFWACGVAAVGRVIKPRIRALPAALGTRGPELVALAERFGYTLDPFQRLAANDLLATVEDDTLAAYEGVLVVSRQCGKSLVGEFYALLFALEGEAVMYTAQRADAVKNIFRRLLAVIPEDMEAKPTFTNGKEEIAFPSGGVIVFRTRGPRVGRAYTFSKLIVDEAQHCTQEELDAAVPTLRTSSDAQILYLGCAANGRTNPYARILWDLRERAKSGLTERLCYLEWSADCRDAEGAELPATDLPEEMLDDEARWLQGTPAIESSRITIDRMRDEREALDPVSFAVEYMNVFVPPDLGGGNSGPVSVDAWAALADDGSEVPPDEDEIPGVVVGFDMNAQRTVHVCVVGRREDELLHLDYAGRFDGATMASAAIRAIYDREDVDVRAIVCDGEPANLDMLRRLERDGVLASVLHTERASQAGVAACGALIDMVAEGKFRHRGQVEFVNALRGSVVKTSSDWWVYSRSRSTTDVSPLMAAAVALWAAESTLELAGECHIF
jgi:hypothetical protein